MNVSDSVAVVTGGASGLGLATTKALIAEGATVVIIDLPSSDGEAVAKELGDRARFSAGDVTDEASVTAALDLAESLGPLRVAVNCAGIGNAIKTVGKQRRVPACRLPEGHPDQPDRHVQRHPPRRRADREDRADRRRARRHRQHRVGRRVRRADRAGRVLGVEGRRRRHDPADRPRPRLAVDPRRHDRAGPVQDPAARVAARGGPDAPSVPRCRTPRASATPASTARSPRTSSRTRCSTAR